MASVNAINNKTDLTVQIFDRFYGYQQHVPVDAYDAVLSYFKSVFGSAEAAGNFTVSVFRISHATNIPVMTLLQEFQGQTAPAITSSLSPPAPTTSRLSCPPVTPSPPRTLAQTPP